jgi:electron transfer flavoprotein alpha subunit
VARELGAADTVVTVAHAALAGYVPEAHQAALEEAIRVRQPAVVLVGCTTAGIDLAAGAAAATGRPLVASCIALRARPGEVEADSQLYGGKLVATTRTPLPAVFSVVAGSFPEAAGRAPRITGAARIPEVIALPAPESLARLRTRLVGTSAADAGTFDITKAERIVSVGRGIGASDDIGLAQELAAALGAELGASRPVVDSGWLPRERQVGKSGMTVKPRLYVAVGISGAPEHLEGMRTAGLIIAINTDPGAPIFQVATYGTTCDFGDLLPALSARLVATG